MGDGGSFVFDDNTWSQVAVVEHAVGTQVFITNFQLYLVCR